MKLLQTDLLSTFGLISDNRVRNLFTNSVYGIPDIEYLEKSDIMDMMGLIKV